MYAAIRQYELGAGSVRELIRVAEEEMAAALSALPGFVRYEVIVSGDDEFVSVTTFEDEESAGRSNQVAAEFVRDHLQRFQLNLTSALSGEVGVSRGEPSVAHAP